MVCQPFPLCRAQQGWPIICLCSAVHPHPSQHLSTPRLCRGIQPRGPPTRDYVGASGPGSPCDYVGVSGPREPPVTMWGHLAQGALVTMWGCLAPGSPL